jgi:hypothetical protein
MKKYLQIITLIVLVGSCKTTGYLQRSDPDKALQDAVKKLNKNAGDTAATRAVPILYDGIQQLHLAKIASYNTGNDLARWDKIIAEYNLLQNAYDDIINSNAAFKLVNPQNFSVQLLETKQNAAEDYYQLAKDAFDKPGRDNAKQAYSYFKKADRYIPNYKDSRDRMNEAFESAVINVVINPVQDNSYFSNSSWGSYGTNYSNEYFQQTLLRDLQNLANNNLYAARFYNSWDARNKNIQADWIVDLRLRNLYIPRPANYSYRRNVSKEINVGKDTLGKPIYQTVRATVNITRISFTARASMEVIISDALNGKNISNRSFDSDYSWQVERGSYRGDSRALSANDLAIINNRNYNAPRQEDVLQELYKQIYPQVKNDISYAADW